MKDTQHNQQITPSQTARALISRIQQVNTQIARPPARQIAPVTVA